MERDTSRGSSLWKILNWVGFAMMTGMLLICSASILLVRGKFLTIFADFGTKLPGITLMVLFTPGVVILIWAALPVGIGVVLQRYHGRVKYPFIFYLVIMGLCGVACWLFVVALFMPLPALINGVMEGQ